MKTLSFLKQYRKDRSGVAALEFALLAPIFAIIIVGTLDIGFFVWEKMQLQNASHAVAEYMAYSQFSGSETAIVNSVLRKTYSGDVNDLVLTSEYECECADEVVMECPADCATAEDYSRRFVKITVSSDFEALFPYPGIPESINLEGITRMRVD